MSETTTETAARIRAEYKKLGWSSRDVAVKTEVYSLGSSISIRLKTAKVDAAKAERIAREIGEHIRRDASGEVLNGGNCYVNVSYSDEYREALALRHVDALAKAVAALGNRSDRALEKIGDLAAWVGFGGHRVGEYAEITFEPEGSGTEVRIHFPIANHAGLMEGAFRLALAQDKLAATPANEVA